MKDLLIISCSKTKRPLQDVPAMDLYDGSVYKVIKKAKPEDLDILIVSAKYGLLRPEDHISYYDQVMTFARSEELQSEVSEGIRKAISENSYRRIFVNLGEMYMLTLGRDLVENIDWNQNSIFASGPFGKCLQQLKSFLENREEGGK